MKVLSVIFGSLMAVMGISLAFTPLMTFMSSGYYLAIMLAVYGIMGIVMGIVSKKYNINFVFSIISIIAGILLVTLPGFMLLTDAMLVYGMAVWFILEGIVGIVNSLRAKKNQDKKWVWGLILGIIGLIVGIYSAFHPLLSAMAMGVLIAVYFIKAGFNLIFAPFMDKEEQ